MFQVFLITFALCLAVFFTLDRLSAGRKAKEAAEKGEEPRGTSVLAGVILSFLIAALVAWAVMMFAHYAQM